MTKGKVATKGKKLIHEENVRTLTYYRYMILASNAVIILLSFLVFAEFPTRDKVLITLSAVVHLASYQFLVFMARARYSSDGQLMDGGLDINMESGVAEHVKDIIILTSLCQTLSAVSVYFWLLWLLLPVRAVHMLWKNVLAPYIFAPAPGDMTDEDSDRKQKKLARKMRYSATSH